MNKRSGKETCLKVTAVSCPENINGNNVVINTIKAITALNAIIKCLNFNGKSPNIEYNKRKIVLRQQCRFHYLARGRK